MLITIWSHFNITHTSSLQTLRLTKRTTDWGLWEVSVMCHCWLSSAQWSPSLGWWLPGLVWCGLCLSLEAVSAPARLHADLQEWCDSTGYTQYQTFTSFHWQLLLIEEGNFLNKKLCPHSNPRGRTLMVALCVYTVVPLSRSGEMSSSELPRCHWDQNK